HYHKAKTPTDICTHSLHDALPIWKNRVRSCRRSSSFSRSHSASSRWARASPEGCCWWVLRGPAKRCSRAQSPGRPGCRSSISPRSEEHTSELQSRGHLVCRLLLEK